MKKLFALSLAMLVALAVGISFIHCGSSDGEKKCEGTAVCCEAVPCAQGTCVDGQCVGCCLDAPAGELQIDVSGQVLALKATGPAGVEVAIAAIAPANALNPTQELVPLAETVSSAAGAYALDCFNVKDVSLGLTILADDKDGAAEDTYFPTLTGIMSFGSDADKVCNDDPPPCFVLENTNVTALDALGIVSKSVGFVMGFVLDASGNFVDGAEMTYQDGSAITVEGNPAVAYPNATGDGFEADGNTSAAGIFIINGAAITGLPYITAKKDGLTFPVYPAGVRPQACFFVSFQAE